MSTRDEAIEALTRVGLAGQSRIMSDGYPSYFVNDNAEAAVLAVDALIAEGWRKKPDEAELEDVIQRHWEAWTGRESQDFRTIVATSVLALMDRGQ